jgi:hypothetical protein
MPVIIDDLSAATSALDIVKTIIALGIRIVQKVKDGRNIRKLRNELQRYLAQAQKAQQRLSRENIEFGADFVQAIQAINDEIDRWDNRTWPCKIFTFFKLYSKPLEEQLAKALREYVQQATTCLEITVAELCRKVDDLQVSLDAVMNVLTVGKGPILEAPVSKARSIEVAAELIQGTQA